jgi:N-acetylmuramidase/Putative peptidoglycan binding domain
LVTFYKEIEMPIPFQGRALALSNDGLSAVAGTLGVFAPEIWTVLAVETSGCGFLPDRRPQILYERHVFHRLTGGQFDDGDISDPTPGGYGPGGSHQYDRLAAAIQLDRAAALQSASWGIGQVMGNNFAMVGFPDVETMVAAMSESEDNQLTAVGAFLTATKLDLSLQAHDWTAFARGYNGPNFAINHYDSRLNGEFQKFSAGNLPDTLARAVQLYLLYLGFHPGPVDGVAGSQTLSALAQFQSQNGLPVSSTVDADTITQLQNALPPI